MSAAVVDVVSVADLVVEVKQRFPEDAEAQALLLLELVSDEVRESWVLQQARHEITRWESNRRKPRSGRLNGSGLVRGAREALAERRSVLELEVMVGGERRLLGDLDAALLDAKIAEYDELIGRLKFRQSPFVALRAEMKRAKVAYVRDLGEERAASVYDGSVA